MRNLREYFERCKREAKAIGFPISDVISIGSSARYKHRFGTCTEYPTGHFAITVNAKLLDEDVPERYLIETLHHELVHTIKGCWNHDANFRYHIERLNAYYGYNITVKVSMDDEIARRVACEGEFARYKYALTCNDCGHTVRRKRASKAVLHPEDFRCAKCGGTLTMSTIEK